MKILNIQESLAWAEFVLEEILEHTSNSQLDNLLFKLEEAALDSGICINIDAVLEMITNYRDELITQWSRGNVRKY